MDILFFSGINLDEYPNEVNTLPENLQQLVTEAMQTITNESSNTNLTKTDSSS